jgi:hypothetical protein
VAEQRLTHQKRFMNAAEFCEITLRPCVCARYAVRCARAMCDVRVGCVIHVDTDVAGSSQKN